MGCGYIGSVLARHLSEKIPEAKIVISDEKIEPIKQLVSSIKKSNISSIQLDFHDYKKLVNLAKNFDLVVGLAPGRLGYKTVEATIEAGVDMVDLSYMPEDPLNLHKKALDSNVTVIPDCGVAPGLSNILVGRAASKLDQVKDVIILVGGLPQKLVQPLNYKVTWCVEDLIEEYTRKARIVKNGETIEVEALSGLEELELPGVGKLEAFYTDGIRTLHHTIKGVENMWEKTLRYPGHAENIKMLRELGFFDKESINGISPCALTAKILTRKLSMPEIKDFVVMKVMVNGIRNDLKVSHSFYLLDYFDERKNITAMGRTTAFTASIVIQLLIRKEIKEKGIVPPEKLGMDDRIFEKIVRKLEEDGVKVIEEIGDF
jgi:saccharopine dehydrogenase-like NADP-dependent oxidoreductase